MRNYFSSEPCFEELTIDWRLLHRFLFMLFDLIMFNLWSFGFSFRQACADAKYYGNVEVYNILKARGAKAPVIKYQ